MKESQEELEISWEIALPIEPENCLVYQPIENLGCKSMKFDRIGWKCWEWPKKRQCKSHDYLPVEGATLWTKKFSSKDKQGFEDEFKLLEKFNRRSFVVKQGKWKRLHIEKSNVNSSEENPSAGMMRPISFRCATSQKRSSTDAKGSEGPIKFSFIGKAANTLLNSSMACFTLCQAIVSSIPWTTPICKSKMLSAQSLPML